MAIAARAAANVTMASAVGAMGFGYGFATLQNPSWSLKQVILATNGRLCNNSSSTMSFRSIVTDSRAVRAGDIFLTLSGDNFDGADFCGEAVKKGAAGVITCRPLSTVPVPQIIVADTCKALGDLAAWRRNIMRNLTVAAITGSSGKTTVKDMTAAILERDGRVIKTRGNFNNLIGLPLSLLPVNFHHDYAVLEMGMNAPGEIARLTEIADPDIACLNNIHPAHLAGLGDIKGVAAAKGELLSYSRSSTTLVVNIDDPEVRRLIRGRRGRMVSFGRRRQAEVRGCYPKVWGENGLAFTLKIGARQGRVRLRALGEHNMLNGLAAAAIAHAAGIEFADIIVGLESFRPSDNRLQLMKLANGLRVINDSYNANPASMRAALAAARKISKGGKCAAVLGDMLELGAFSAEAHGELGGRVAKEGFDYLLAMGEFAGIMAAGAVKAGMDRKRIVTCAGAEEMNKALSDLLGKGKIGTGDLLLIKGSRGMRMERFIEPLKLDEFAGRKGD